MSRASCLGVSDKFVQVASGIARIPGASFSGSQTLQYEILKSTVVLI